MESDEVINQLWTISINQINFANLEHYMNLNNVESYAHIERKYQPWICNVSFAKNRLAWTIELMNINITFRFDFYWVSRNGSSGLRLILVGVAGCEAIKKHWHGLLEWPLSGLSRVPHYHWGAERWAWTGVLDHIQSTRSSWRLHAFRAWTFPAKTKTYL